MEEEQPSVDEAGAPCHQSDESAAGPTSATPLGRINGDTKTDAQQIMKSAIQSSGTQATANAILLGSSARRSLIRCPVCGESFTRTFLLRKHQTEQCGIKCLRCSAVVSEPKMEQHLLTAHGLPAGLKRNSNAQNGPVTKTFVLCDNTFRRQEVQFHQLSGVVCEGYTCTVRKPSTATRLTQVDAQQAVKVTPVKVLVDAKVHPLTVSSRTFGRSEAVKSLERHAANQASQNDGQETALDSVLTIRIASPDHTDCRPKSPAAGSIEPPPTIQTGKQHNVSLTAHPTCESNDVTGIIAAKRKSPHDRQKGSGYTAWMSPESASVNVIDSDWCESRAEQKRPVCCGQRFITIADFRHHVITNHVFKCLYCKKSFVDDSQRLNHEKIQHQRSARGTKKSNESSSKSNAKTVTFVRSKKGGAVTIGSTIQCHCGAPYKTQRSFNKHIERCGWSARKSGQVDSNRRKTHQPPTGKSRSAPISGVAAAKRSSVFVVRTVGCDADGSVANGSVTSATSVVTAPVTMVAHQFGGMLRCEPCKLTFDQPEAAERHRSLVHKIRPKMFRHSAAMFGGGQRRNVIVTGLRGAPLPKQTSNLQCRYCPKTFRTKQTLLTHCSKYHAHSVIPISV